MQKCQLEDPSVDCFGNLSGISFHSKKVEVGLTKEHWAVLKAGLKDIQHDLGCGQGANIICSLKGGLIVILSNAILEDDNALGEFNVELGM